LYSKVCIGKSLSDAFPIQNGLKEPFLPSLYNFALEYAIRKVHENQKGLGSNGTHQLLDYADNVCMLGDHINTIKKNPEAPLGAGKEAGLEVNKEKTKYMFMSYHQNGGQNHYLLITNKSFDMWKIPSTRKLTPWSRILLEKLTVA